MNRRSLAYVVAGLAVLGLIAAAIPLAQSWRINEGAKRGHLSIDISDMPLGSFKTLDRGTERIFVLRSSSDIVTVIAVPIFSHEVFLPDRSWRTLIGPCHRFEPENVNGNLAVGGSFRCFDPEVASYQVGSWRWTYEGRLTNPVAGVDLDLPLVHFERSGNTLTVRRPR